MPILDKGTLESIRTSVDIVDIISSYMPLQKKGSNYWGVCPFHADTNPSMCVSQEKQIFTCFVCHKTGNVYNFIMDYEHLSFMEAVKKVADRGNIKLDINITTHDLPNSNLYKIYEDTEKIYQNNINNSFGDEARKYLLDRGIDDNIIKEFGIGLSLKTRDVLVKSFANKKYDVKDLIDSGLVIKNEYGIVDIYQNRIMFPLWDLNGHIVGYSGRIYDTVDGAKYINSKETAIFKKGELLYNYHRSRDIIRTMDTVIVMEGFMDIIGAYKIGVLNTVAMMGTAVTKYQANLIRRMASNIILLFDGDSAGAKATMRSIDEFVSIGVTPKVVRLEEDLDPDDYIKKYGKDKFMSKLSNPINIMDFKLSFLKQGKDLTSDVEKAKYTKDMLQELSNIDDDILIELTLKKLSLESGLDIAFLKSQLHHKEQVANIPVHKQVEPKTDKYVLAEQGLLFYMLKDTEAIKIYDNIVTYLPTDKYRFLAREIDFYYNEYGSFNMASFMDMISPKEELVNTTGEIMSLNLREDVRKEDIIAYAASIQEYNIKRAKDALEEELKHETDTSKKAIIGDQIKDYGEQIRKLKVRGNE